MLVRRAERFMAISLMFILVTMMTIPFVLPLDSMDETSIIDTDSRYHEYVPQATPAPVGLVAYWEMNENGGLLARDSVSSANDGQLNGPVQWVTAVAQSGLQINEGGWVYCGQDPALSIVDDLTIEAWINIAQFIPGYIHTIVENHIQNDRIPKIFHFGVLEGRLYYDRYNPGGEALSSRSISEGEWHHVAAVVSRSAGTVTFYIDGAEEQPIYYNDGIYGTSGFVVIGAQDPLITNPPQQYSLQGQVDEVAIWRALLSADTILQHYENGLRGLGYLETIPENTPPVALNDAYETDEDTMLDIGAPGVLENDDDVDYDPLTAGMVTGPIHGSLDLSPDGGFQYTPSPDWFGMDSFTYQAFDGIEYSGLATVTITVLSVNDVPMAGNDDYVTGEDIVLMVPFPGVLGNDIDLDQGETLQAVLVTDTQYGSLTLHPDGGFEYFPDTDWNGVDQFEYQAVDSFGAYSQVAFVTITVTALNDGPWAMDDYYIALEDTELVVPSAGYSGVLDNDIDIDGDPLVALLDTSVSSGSLVLNPDGSFLYTPNPDWSGIDTFTYHVTDGQLDSNIATVTITVEPVNDPPTVMDDAFSMEEDTTLDILASQLLSNDEDIEGDVLQIMITNDPSDGTLVQNPDGSFTYIPDADWSGVDQFEYQVFDGTDYSGAAVVTITVVSVNDAPWAMGESYFTDQDTQLLVPSAGFAGVLENDYDIDGDPLVADLVAPTSHGLLTLYLDGAFVYTPDPGWSGVDTFEYRAFDGLAYSNAVLVTIEVIPAVDDDETGPIITITYLGDSTDGDSGLWTITVEDPESGIDWITVEIDGVLVGTSAGNYIVPNTLGLHTIRVNATNADLDTGPDDQEFSTRSSGVTIVDDDTTAPEITIVYTGDATDTNPGYWTISVIDSESGVGQVTVEIDGVWVGDTPGDYDVPSSLGTHTIHVIALNADLDRDVADQEQNTTRDSVTISSPTPTFGRVLGVGWIEDSEGSKGHFMFYVAHTRCRGPGGFAIYKFKADGNHYFVTTTEILRLVIDGNHAYFEAEARVFRINLRTCDYSHSIFTLRIDVWDNKGCQSRDVFQIRIFDTDGQLWHEAGFDPYGYLVRGSIHVITCNKQYWSRIILSNERTLHPE